MASKGWLAFSAYVDSRSGSARDKAALKLRGEQLYLAIGRELLDLVEALGDADVGANPSDTALAARQAALETPYAKSRMDGVGMSLHLFDHLEGN